MGKMSQRSADLQLIGGASHTQTSHCSIRSRSNRGGASGRANYYLGSWISARRCTHCTKCGCDIIQGDTVKYIPCGKRLLCYSCGQTEGQAILGFVRAPQSVG